VSTLNDPNPKQSPVTQPDPPPSEAASNASADLYRSEASTIPAPPHSLRTDADKHPQQR